MNYGALAPIYDRVMSHVDYYEWLDLIGRIAVRFAPQGVRTVFEIGAGTGTLGAALLSKGYDYQGSDLSFPMCSTARASRNLSFICTDARFLPVHGPFDLLLFLYDGINYLPERGDYLALFAEADRVLAPGGLFLFDITTTTNSKRHFISFHDSECLQDYSYTRHSHFDPAGSIQHNDFVIYPHTGHDLHPRTEYHTQWVHDFRAIASWVPAQRFSVEGVWDGYTFRRATTRSTRIHFLLRKRNATGGEG